MPSEFEKHQIKCTTSKHLDKMHNFETLAKLAIKHAINDNFQTACLTQAAYFKYLRSL